MSFQIKQERWYILIGLFSEDLQ